MTMIQVVAVTLLVVGLSVASPLTRDKRQACIEPPVANLCSTNSLAGPVNLPHPTDNTKFLQCAAGGRMFIIKCPAGETYNHGTTSCGKPQVITPVVNPTNPCTADTVQRGNIFFPYPSDNHKFIECKAVNQPTILSCPSRLVYDAGRQSCVFVAGTSTGTATGTTGTGTTGTGTTGTGTGTGTTGTGTTNTGTVGTGGNPCAQASVNINNLFFPSPDPSQFFQCDLAGNAYLMHCPAGLIWNQATSQCGTVMGTSGATIG